MSFGVTRLRITHECQMSWTKGSCVTETKTPSVKKQKQKIGKRWRKKTFMQISFETQIFDWAERKRKKGKTFIAHSKCIAWFMRVREILVTSFQMKKFIVIYISFCFVLQMIHFLKPNFNWKWFWCVTRNRYIDTIFQVYLYRLITIANITKMYYRTRKMKWKVTN